MWWYGRGNTGGSWLPEEKKNLCGTEGEIVVAHGRLPSPAPRRIHFYLFASSLIIRSFNLKLSSFPCLSLFLLYHNNSKAYQTFYCRLDMADL